MSLARNERSNVGTSGTSARKKAASWIAIAATAGASLIGIASAEGCTISTDVNDGGFEGTDASSPDGRTTSDTGTSDTGTDTSAPPLNACNECLFAQCSAQWTVCMGSDCQGIYACATAPGCTGNCPTNCFNSGSAAGQRIYYALASCDLAGMCGKCSNECASVNHDCSQLDAGTQPDAATPATCDQCVADNCSGEKSKCAGGSDCDTYTQCLAGCQDTACINKCGEDHATGKTDATNLGTCTSSNCANKCGL